MSKRDNIAFVVYESAPEHDTSFRMKMLLVALAPTFLCCLSIIWIVFISGGN